jgi:hypothetical protein
MINVAFDQFDKRGLKSVLDAFKKANMGVAATVADNKPKREAGYQVKTATLTLDSGQVVVLKIKAEGSLYQAKLNGKVLAIKKYHDPNDFIKEVIAYAKENEGGYAKSKEKAALRATKIKVPTLAAVSIPLAQQVEALNSSLTEITAQNEDLNKQLFELTAPLEAKRTALAELNKELADEKARTETLQSEIDALEAQGYVLESAGKGKITKAELKNAMYEPKGEYFVEPQADGSMVVWLYKDGDYLNLATDKLLARFDVEELTKKSPYKYRVTRKEGK